MHAPRPFPVTWCRVGALDRHVASLLDDRVRMPLPACVMLRGGVDVENDLLVEVRPQPPDSATARPGSRWACCPEA